MALPHSTYGFDEFELDVDAYELRYQGRMVRLERRAMELLLLLVERHGRLVTRAEIVERVWGGDVFVDVETGVNTLIWKVRQALRDPSDAPRFIETVARKGYRFIAPVREPETELPAPPPTPEPPVTASALSRAPEQAVSPALAAGVPRGLSRRVPLLAGAALLGALGLWIWRSTTPTVPQMTIAVLPFENLSGDPNREYIADGLSEETIATLRLWDPDRLRVIGGASMMRFKHARPSLAQIGKEVGADYLIESSLRAEGSLFRVTSKLIRVDDETRIWSGRFERDASSMFGLPREISKSIAEQVQLHLTPARALVLARRESRDAIAQDLYLQGRHFVNQRTPAANTLAVDYLTRATERDSGFALAWAALAETYASSPVNADADPAVAAQRARYAAARAVAADEHLAEAQTADATVNFWFNWDWREAEHAARRAVHSDPEYARGHLMLAVVLSHMGRFPEAAHEIGRAIKISPLDPINHAIASEVAFRSRNWSVAIEHANRSLVFGSEFWIGYMTRAQAYEQAPDMKAALRDLVAAARLSDNNAKTLALRGYILAKTSRQSEARKIAVALEDMFRERYVPPYAIALIYAGLGNADAAFSWLEQAYRVRDVHLVFLTIDPKWDAFRDDVRFRALVDRCNFFDGN